MDEDAFQALADRLAALEGRLERMFRYGTIVDDKDIDVSDASKPRARIEVGKDDDDKSVLGPMVPYSTVAGARNQHNPPSKGQQLLQIAPDGDHEQAILIPLGHSDNVKSPSTDPKTYVDQIGKTVNTQKDGSWKQEVEKASTAMSKGKIDHRVGDQTEHLLVEGGQRIKVESRTKLVLKFGDTTYAIKEDALEPVGDIQDSGSQP